MLVSGMRYTVSMHQLYDSRRSPVLSTGRGAGPPGFRPLRALMTQCNVLTHHTWNAEQIMEKWWNSQPKRESSQRLYFQEKSIHKPSKTDFRHPLNLAFLIGISIGIAKALNIWTLAKVEGSGGLLEQKIRHPTGRVKDVTFQIKKYIFKNRGKVEEFLQ